MSRNALVIGGTGMLKDVTIWLHKQGYTVSVIGRNAKRMADIMEQTDSPESILPICVDYRNEKQFRQAMVKLANTENPIDLVVSWIHSDAPVAFATMTKYLSRAAKEDWRLFHIRGSAAHLSTETVFVPENCLYREVILGFIIENDTSRWLTHQEISSGVIQAIKGDRKKSIVGCVEPWDMRP
ncbi:short-chain dehydrogenase [Virgibacillus sp. 179-BFC.A HS]|uniref:Short-chain dehydrogenase n=1 Tax=Tigheibacillus jepli TaxID=3035914 RepID=A0ABU5CKV8_9BACI|nr:short-chain dehydrogenase [Virgibacillus sp. 179-BFC.A HS]MDY0406959.1 short-chain dehydrogenase [Virgibacillus sp. 179-BFC.A HS]